MSNTMARNLGLKITQGKHQMKFWQTYEGRCRAGDKKME